MSPPLPAAIHNQNGGNPMKRFSGFLMFALIMALFVPALYATNPTVTMSEEARTEDVIVYEFSYATTAANLDTAILWKDITNSTPWDISYMRAPDSVVFFQLETNEATADSCNNLIVYQMCYDSTPTTRSVADDEWVTVRSDTNTGAVSIADKLNVFQVGFPYKLRILVIETNANKDAAQTITGRIVFPHPLRQYRR